jgi:RNA polymerase sigma-70 factor (ECF subfamily)
MDNIDERRALEGLRILDAQVISEIYDKYFPEIYRYVRYRLGDVNIAEDITSDVFVRLLEAAKAGTGPQTNLKAWLITTASHAVNDFLRRNYTRPIIGLTDDIVDPDSAPADEFDHHEQLRSFRQAYSQLTSEQQHVLALRFGQGYSLEETAAILKKTVNAVKAIQFRALTSLHRKTGEVPYE